jgi:hypothetical protein
MVNGVLYGQEDCAPERSVKGATSAGTTLLTLEAGLSWSAFASKGDWQNQRADWVARSKSATMAKELATLVIALERSIAWSAVTDAWRGRRDAWLQQLERAATPEDVGMLTTELQQNTLTSAQCPPAQTAPAALTPVPSASPVADADPYLGKAAIGLGFDPASPRCVIRGVRKGYPAESAGFFDGDVVVWVGTAVGTEVNDQLACTQAMIDLPVGARSPVLVERRGVRTVVEVVPVTRIAGTQIEKVPLLPLPPPPTELPNLGLVIAREPKDRCILTGATIGRPAEGAGFLQGDRLVRVGGRAVDTYNSCMAAMARLRVGEPTTLDVARAGQTISIRVTPAARLPDAEEAKLPSTPFPENPAPVASDGVGTVGGPTPTAAPSSAVLAGTPQRTAYALVVGIEKYRDLPAPTGARTDATRFAEVLRKTFGVPDQNLRVALDDRASKTDIERHLAWLKTNVPAGGRVYFFFSGHGAPDAAQGTAYLVPYDSDAQAITQTGMPMSDVLKALGESKAKDVVAFVDTCFSGAGGRSVLPKGARPLVRVLDPVAPSRVSVLASSSGSEISGPSADGSQGVFTKHLLDGIGSGRADTDGDGQITLEELSTWITPRVKRDAQQQQRMQTPRLSVPVGTSAKDIAVVWGVRP